LAIPICHLYRLHHRVSLVQIYTQSVSFLG
jgi:hypothetical protein